MFPKINYFFMLKVAMDQEFNIGKGNKLPWKIPSEMRNFKRDIKDYPLVMGRNTCESIKKPLNNHPNYVLTSNKDYHKEGFITINSINQLMDIVPKGKMVYVIGGAKIYEAFLKLGDMHSHTVTVNAEITTIHNTYPDCDSKFPMELIEKYKYTAMDKTEGYDSGVYWKERFYYKELGK